MRDDSPEAAAFRDSVLRIALEHPADVEAIHAWLPTRAYGDPVADLDRAAVIFTALDRGWRPDPAVQRGVTIADCLRQGDKWGRYWLLTEPRALGNPAEDRPALETAADAATTFLNSIPRPEEK